MHLVLCFERQLASVRQRGPLLACRQSGQVRGLAAHTAPFCSRPRRRTPDCSQVQYQEHVWGEFLQPGTPCGHKACAAHGSRHMCCMQWWGSHIDSPGCIGKFREKIFVTLGARAAPRAGCGVPRHERARDEKFVSRSAPAPAPRAGCGVPRHEPARDDVRGRRRARRPGLAGLPGHGQGRAQPAGGLAVPDRLPGGARAGRHGRPGWRAAGVLGRRAALLLRRLPRRAPVRAGAGPMRAAHEAAPASTGCGHWVCLPYQ
jgi:hypothetical protein